MHHLTRNPGFTLGEWKLTTSGLSVDAGASPESRMIRIRQERNPVVPPAELAANARLIAMAPETYRAARELLNKVRLLGVRDIGVERAMVALHERLKKVETLEPPPRPGRKKQEGYR